MSPYGRGMQKAAYVLGMSQDTFGHAAELAGLGVLAGYPAYHLYKHLRGGGDADAKEHMAELAGLGILAAPAAVGLLKHH